MDDEIDKFYEPMHYGSGDDQRTVKEIEEEKYMHAILHACVGIIVYNNYFLYSVLSIRS